ncbi:urate hydroxylase PuuD [Roseateles koreensis]|uniref:Urate hydroxylase PuuD n=1 Tax=Roseateles koreensis TaxID=2987526 RepID=A0ABT5KQN2_9BURK|nr:urate hydroxylase PuuD [Roseateles koreensis]MDC8785216.1 urate hydroxylase PuuD [Roseateles koreensis]
MDTSYLLDWANLLLRWTHVITVIAWAGSSFYFVFLDNSLTPPTSPELLDKGVSGELWAVHGGGFYNPQKYLVAPKQLPKNLHWFYWESYATWLSGMGLFSVLYLFNAGTFMVDRRVHDWPAAAAVGTALAFLLVFWLAYDAICRSLGRKKNGDLIVGACLLVLVLGATWLACQLFAGRAAFVLVGAMLATSMSANVLVWIIPGQRRVVAQLKAGQTVDPLHGWRAKQRSVHNTYFTLPVLIAMLSNHYGWLFEGPRNWAVLSVLMVAGALIRHFFVARHKAAVQGVKPPYATAAAGVLMVLGLMVWLAPAPSASQARPADADAPVAFAALKTVIEQRCVMCHNATVQNKGIALHTPELIQQHAQAVYQQAAVLKQMPLNNATQITQAERLLIKHWFEAGAPAQ